MKRLRKSYPHDTIRFFHCGEYGEQLSRPHYHACLFGIDFPDQTLWTIVNGQKLYRSASLERLWRKGFSTIGTITWQSAAYVARYITKKITGAAASTHYERICKDTGEVSKLKPEYTTMSRRPGIGSNWFTQYHSDVYPGDFVVIDGKKYKPPRYYDKLHELVNPEGHKAIKLQRIQHAQKHQEDQTPQRLAVREIVSLKKLEQLPRTYEAIE